MRHSYLILLVLTCLVPSNSRLAFKKVTHQTDPRAKCLDGSSPALLISEGDPNFIQVHLMQGGNCKGNTEEEVLQNCYERSQTELGSSTFWEETYSEENTPF